MKCDLCNKPMDDFKLRVVLTEKDKVAETLRCCRVCFNKLKNRETPLVIKHYAEEK